MNGLTSRLRNKVNVYGKVEFINELEQKDYRHELIKTIYAEITPQSGSIKESPGNTQYADISHKIVIRSNSIPNLENDMYFIYKGQRYNVKHFIPNYKFNDSVEIFCSLEVE